MLDVECGWDTPTTCESICQSELDNDDPQCVDAVRNYRMCETMTTCDAFEADCGGLLNLVADTCIFLPPDECGVAGRAELDGSACEISIECGGQPLKKVSCDDVTCVCTVGGEATGSCDVGTLCTDIGPSSNGADLPGIVAGFVGPCCGF